jgi:hypothetical protein
MSGTYFVVNQDAPGGIAETMAAVAAGVAQAYGAYATTAAETRQFFVANGRDVVGGHPDVNEPGRQGDPDPTLDASDY